MLTHSEYRVLSIKTFVDFKCSIDIDLDFYVRVRTCVNRVTGKQPLVMYLASVMYFAPTCAKFMSRHGWSDISQTSEISLDTELSINRQRLTDVFPYYPAAEWNKFRILKFSYSHFVVHT